MTTLGLEEEYLLLEPQSGLPAHHAARVQRLLEAAPEISEDEIQRELLSCQIETATPVCTTLVEAEQSLLTFRRTLSDAARTAGSIGAATGAAPAIRQSYPELTDKKRYEDLRASAPGIVGDQFVNGLHVHVGIPDQERGIQALNRIRPWIPLLTALSVNSPYWFGRDSGFGSWRVIHYRRWAVQGGCALLRGCRGLRAAHLAPQRLRRHPRPGCPHLGRAPVRPLPHPRAAGL